MSIFLGSLETLGEPVDSDVGARVDGYPVFCRLHFLDFLHFLHSLLVNVSKRSNDGAYFGSSLVSNSLMIYVLVAGLD